MGRTYIENRRGIWHRFSDRFGHGFGVDFGTILGRFWGRKSDRIRGSIFGSMFSYRGEVVGGRGLARRRSLEVDLFHG